ncbi:hypothetical protein AAD018_017375 [Aestuariibius insulae]|uniref:hypothetical protein n=1 Tax=Aestuariibius insulae TaxID=2058287 RepID=UPI00345E7549
MKGPLMATMLLAAGAQAASAETRLDAAQMDGLLTGNTVYISIPPGAPGMPDGGIAPFKFGGNGSAAAKLPTGLTLVGTWSLGDDRYCVDWENGPKNSCTYLIKTEGSIAMYDPDGTAERGMIERIVPGNPEGL